MLNIVLLNPEMPANTGNIGRTCVVIGARLHLIKPLGFDISEKAVKRSGLDYWNEIDLVVHESYEDFVKTNPEICYYATTKAKQTYADVDYTKNREVYLMFGAESKGIPEEIIAKNMETSVRMPMKPQMRSLNLSNAVCAMAYEVLRQNEFYELEKQGKLTTGE